jgi:4-alpha-glucanotransferase
MFDRSSGILLPIFSLPGPWGIGTFGPEAREFAGLAARAGFRYWQVLPMPPTSAGDSPYQGLSANAGNPYLLDLRPLAEQGLLTGEELETARYRWEPERIDYGWLYETREDLLRKAFARLPAATAEAVRAFRDGNADWLPDYVLFRTIKRHFGDRPWWSWPDASLRRHEPDALARFAADHADELGYHAFVQYEFDRQWRALKADVNALGLGVVGDMPIYVAHDSSDAWARSDLFEMDGDSGLVRVAGVPPDYFSADGQLWGNPLYRWDRMAEDGYRWWLDRIRSALATFDVLRIDHFRGFESY